MFRRQKQPTEIRSNVTYHYANVATVSTTDSEMIVTFGTVLVQGDRPEPQPSGCRVYMNYFSGKRFSIALQMSIDRHVKAFGPIATKGKPVSNTVPSRSVYANYMKIQGNPEELLIDFGINPDAATTGTYVVHTQVAMQYSTVKQLADEVSNVILDYERRHGNLELSIQKRLA